jgi:3',5'-cyclic AMP phosphodiesterase CpdA
LEADLSSTDQPLKVVFLHHPPFDPDGTDHIMLHGNEKFMALVEEYDVSHVFTGHIHAYVEGLRNDVRYIITGGGGAPLYITGHPNAFYHYVRVTVSGANVITEVVKINAP